MAGGRFVTSKGSVGAKTCFLQRAQRSLILAHGQRLLKSRKKTALKSLKFIKDFTFLENKQMEHYNLLEFSSVIGHFKNCLDRRIKEKRKRKNNQNKKKKQKKNE